MATLFSPGSSRNLATVAAAFACLLCIATLAGCGQTGALYLPVEQVAPPQAADEENEAQRNKKPGERGVSHD